MTPEALDLMDEAVSVLRKSLATTLSGERRYLALLTANAVAMARREAILIESLEAARNAVRAYPVVSIRSGALDDDTRLYEKLFADAALRAWVADPAALSAEQQRQFLPRIAT